MATTYDEYQRGWEANAEHRRDQQNLNYSGSTWSALGYLISLYGTCAFLCMVMVTYQLGWDHMNHPAAEIIGGSGLAILPLAYVCFRKGRKAYKRAEVAFKAKWNSREAAPTLAVKTFEDPVTEDDMKLLAMAAVRLTKDHPDLAQELVTLKVRMQKQLRGEYD